MYKPGFWQKCISYLWPVNIETIEGQSAHSLEVNLYRGKCMLDTSEVNYSFGELHRVMELVLESINTKDLYEQVLILGYGGGSTAQIIREKYDFDAQIVGVENDSQVIKLAQKYFYSSEVKLIHADAFEYVKKASKHHWTYSLIVIDLFVNGNIPSFTDEFVSQLMHIMQPQSKVVLNTMLNSEEFEKVGNQFKQAGLKLQAWNDIPQNRVWILTL